MSERVLFCSKHTPTPPLLLSPPLLLIRLQKNYRPCMNSRDDVFELWGVKSKNHSLIAEPNITRMYGASMATFDPFDSEPHFMSSTQIHEQSARRPVSHHKKNSTFANVPYAGPCCLFLKYIPLYIFASISLFYLKRVNCANSTYNDLSIMDMKCKKTKTVTNGMDDFIGFSPTETRLNAEIKELKEIVRENQDIIDAKDVLIRQLREENRELKQLVEQLTSKQPSPSPQPDDAEHDEADSSNLHSTQIQISSPAQWQQVPSRTRGPRSSSFSRQSPSSILTKGSALFSKQNKGAQSHSNSTSYTKANFKGNSKENITKTPRSTKTGKSTKNNKSLKPGFEAGTTSSNHLNDPTKHDLSPSISHFLHDLDVRFKDDDSDHLQHRDVLHHGRDAGGRHMMTPSNTPFPSGANPQSEEEMELYVSTSAMMETNDSVDGHLPQFLHLRRSSLSEEERQAMELQASKDDADDFSGTPSGLLFDTDAYGAAGDGDGDMTRTGDGFGGDAFDNLHEDDDDDDGLARIDRVHNGIGGYPLNQVNQGNVVSMMNPMLMEEGNDTIETGFGGNLNVANEFDSNMANVVFNDSNVANMSLNVINHHQHMMYNEVAQAMESDLDAVKAENRRLEAMIEEMMKSKMELVVNTAKEINRLRNIIREYIK